MIDVVSCCVCVCRVHTYIRGHMRYGTFARCSKAWPVMWYDVTFHHLVLWWWVWWGGVAITFCAVWRKGCLMVLRHDQWRCLTWNVLFPACLCSLWKLNCNRLCTFYQRVCFEIEAQHMFCTSENVYVCVCERESEIEEGRVIFYSLSNHL